MPGVVVQIDGYDPVAGAAVTLRAGSHDDPAVCHLDGQTWWPALTKLPVLRYDLFDGAFGGQITAPSSTLKLSAEPWPHFGRYALADARLRLWTGDVGRPWSQWTLRFDGRVSEQPELDDGQADVGFAVDDRWLDTALLTTYAGTTGAEGTAELKGQPKPLALGAPRYVAGTLIDPVNSIFQVSAYGAIEGLEAALERLARYGTPTGDFASHAALVAATVPAGRWATCLAEGKARLGAPPVGQISFLVKGDKAGPDGWARKPGQLIRRLALLSGGTGKIHDASLNALDTARPYPLSLYVDQQITARQLIQQLAASVNAVAGMSWTGQLFVVPVTIGASSMTLAADGSALPPVGKVKQLGIAAPFKTLAIGAARAWTVHALADIAFTATLVDMGAYAAGTTYREGNLVQSGGSTWLYINPAATSGNAPPTLPTEENAYWRVLAKAGATGGTGPAGANPSTTSLTASKLQVRYDATGAFVAGQAITFHAEKQYSHDVSTVWRLRNAAGTVIIQSNSGASFATALGNGSSAADDSTVTMSASAVQATMVDYGGTARAFSVGAVDFGEANWDDLSIQAVQDGAKGDNAPLVLVQWSIDGATAWHATYSSADRYYRQSNDGGATYGPAILGVGENGAVGADGTSPSSVFKLSATVPSTPTDNTGNPPTGWSDGPPSGTGYLWLSTATFRGATQLTSWSVPRRITGDQGPQGPAGPKGDSAPLVLVQWSTDGATAWHSGYSAGDRYYRQSNDGGTTYGSAILGVGENGAVGADGTSPSSVFKLSATVPSAPTDSTGNPPTGWSDGPPSGTGYLWLSTAIFRGATQLTSWSSPKRITGDQGPQGDTGPKGDPGTPGTGVNKPSVTATSFSSWSGTSYTLIAETSALAITGGIIVVEAVVTYGASSSGGATGQLTATYRLVDGTEQALGTGAVGGLATPANPGAGEPAVSATADLTTQTGSLSAGQYIVRLYARNDRSSTANVKAAQSALIARNN